MYQNMYMVLSELVSSVMPTLLCLLTRCRTALQGVHCLTLFVVTVGCFFAADAS